MIRTTPFHERTSALNETGLWGHWAGYLTPTKYQLSEKFEYFAVRNSAGMFDTSPLYKYRIHGRDAERYLSGVLARNIRKCRPGRAQYTLWCDDDGFVIEDGVINRLSENEFLLSAAEPNLAYLRSQIGYAAVEIDDVSDEIAALSFQGPRSKAILSSLSPDVDGLRIFHSTATKVGDVPVTVSRTGFTGDLGYEIWVDAGDALELWDEVAAASEGYGVLPFGETALLMTRIEAGLLLLEADFSSSRYAWTDADRSTPLELGFDWMFRDLENDDRVFIGREAIRRELVAGSRRRLVGLMIDWRAWDELYDRNGLVPPKDHTPVAEESILYDDGERRVGYATSFMYSPMVQRHIAIGHVRPELATIGSEVAFEVIVNHTLRYVTARVARMPFYNPAHKTS